MRRDEQRIGVVGQALSVLPEQPRQIEFHGFAHRYRTMIRGGLGGRWATKIKPQASRRTIRRCRFGRLIPLTEPRALVGSGNSEPRCRVPSDCKSMNSRAHPRPSLNSFARCASEMRIVSLDRHGYRASMTEAACGASGLSRSGRRLAVAGAFDAEPAYLVCSPS